jgi:metal-dependent amidase/aminoacylase/carboxypeptidase family protein
MENLKQLIIQKIDDSGSQLLQLSADIHSHPELAYNEHQSAGFIVQLLRNNGYESVIPYSGLDTAFRAECRGKADGPHVAILAEYDALPEIGHGCGHNIIATTAVGAFLGLAPLMKDLDGTLSLIGTPAEEGGGGKIAMLEQGGFEGHRLRIDDPSNQWQVFGWSRGKGRNTCLCQLPGEVSALDQCTQWCQCVVSGTYPVQFD